MSSIHQCKDGSQDITGRGTPGKVPCKNGGGKLFPLTVGERVAIDDYNDCPQGGGPIDPNNPCVLKLTGTFQEMTPEGRVQVRIEDYKGQAIIGNYHQMSIIKSLGMAPPPTPDVEGCMDSEALNYNELAVTDDGTCEYDEDIEDTEEPLGLKTRQAGFLNDIPKVVWWMLGIGVIYYYGQKNKWF